MKTIQTSDLSALQAQINQFLHDLPTIYNPAYPVLVDIQYSGEPQVSALVVFALFNVEDPDQLPPP